MGSKEKLGDKRKTNSSSGYSISLPACHLAGEGTSLAPFTNALEVIFVSLSAAVPIFLSSWLNAGRTWDSGYYKAMAPQNVLPLFPLLLIMSMSSIQLASLSMALMCALLITRKYWYAVQMWLWVIGKIQMPQLLPSRMAGTIQATSAI